MALTNVWKLSWREGPGFLTLSSETGLAGMIGLDWQMQGLEAGGTTEARFYHRLSGQQLQTPTRTPRLRANMSDERRPRSRFDSDEPERAPRSRFDTTRRSRSPSRRESESHRERSPVTREGTDSPANAGTKNKAAAAAAAAARINAQIQAKKGIQHVDVPPIRSVRASVAILSHSH